MRRWIPTLLWALGVLLQPLLTVNAEAAPGRCLHRSLDVEAMLTRAEVRGVLRAVARRTKAPVVLIGRTGSVKEGVWALEARTLSWGGCEYGGGDVFALTRLGRRWTVDKPVSVWFFKAPCRVRVP